MKNIYVLLNELLEQGRRVALGTIIDTRGSAPQVPGASAVFASEGLLAGTLGGGLLEGNAQEIAMNSLKDLKPLLYECSLTDDITSEEGAICGGSASILVDPSPEESKEVFHQLIQSLLERTPGILATFIKKYSDTRISIHRTWIDNDRSDKDLASPYNFYQHEIKNVLSEKKPILIKIKKTDFTSEAKENLLFLEYIFPFPQLIIAGAGHIGQAVAHLGHLLDFEVTVLDDRPEFANKERIPEADHIIVDNIGEAIRNFPVSKDTYIVIVTRGHQHDSEALLPCINSEAAYIGMIGSKRKIELMRKRYIEEGWASLQQFDSVHAPIGLSINSKTVQEIAVSITSELVLVRSKNQEKREKGSLY